MKPVTTTNTFQTVTKSGGERSLDSTTKSFLDAHKTVTRSLLTNGFGDEDNPWAAIAAPLPSTTVRALNSSSPAVPKATGSSALRVRQAERVMSDGAGHGRVQRTISSTHETQSPTHPM
ncbi:hypothetical protein BDL97_05G071100 [Sphagnum fallax]|jgi:hypothetical protein|nr:hypothetical protein BDL97_05G071100 [Sphagnum fallax]